MDRKKICRSEETDVKVKKKKILMEILKEYRRDVGAGRKDK